MRRVILPAWPPSAVLLAVQLLGVLLFPFLSGEAGRAALSLFGLAALILAVRAVQASPALTWISLLLGVPIAILLLVDAVGPLDPTLQLIEAVLLAVFYAYTCYALIRYMFHDRRITHDELFATGATFTVLAWTFAYVYEAVQLIWPGSFAGGASSGPFGWFELLFLSFTNLTSVGLSDILPVLPNARSIVMVEQVAGLMYVALVISSVVGLQLRRHGRDPDPQAQKLDEA
jgi:Ion channel